MVRFSQFPESSIFFSRARGSRSASTSSTSAFNAIFSLRAAFHRFSTLRIHSINTETFDGNEDAIKEAKAVLESQGAGYRNFSIDSASDTGRYASDIMAFPTTILVDRNGNIVGDPLLGGIDNHDNYDALMKQIQAVADADSTDK